MTQAQTKKLYQPFPITSVARADLISAGFPEHEVMSVDDDEMARLAEKMADAYTGGDTFWIDLDILAEDILHVRKPVASKQLAHA